MTKPRQSLERQHERLERETREGVGDNASASPRKAPGGEPWGNDHPVNIRLSIPLFVGRYYVTLVAGKERRSGERLASERNKHPLMKLGNLVVMAACGTLCGLVALAMFQLATAFVLLRSGTMVLGQ
ncbi:MAG: hypothetical protein O7F75_04525 [Alphaproteobacteria bacterium]|nr:hypothetical protein [Alphaproteobacteria bacterium]